MEKRNAVMAKIVDKEHKVNMVTKVNPNDKKIMVRRVDSISDDKGNNERQESIIDNLLSSSEYIMQEPIKVSMCKVVDKDKPNDNEKKVTKKVKIGFKESYDGLYQDDVYVMNATVEILDIQSSNELSGAGEKVHCRVHVFNKRPIEKVISVREFREGRWLWDYAAISFKCDKRQALDKIYQYMNFLLEQADVTISSFTERQGWTTADGHHCYVTVDGVVGGDKSVKAQKGAKWKPMLSPMHQEKCFEFFVGMGDVTKQNPTAIIIMLYLIQSVMYSLYKEAKVVPKYCLFVEGPKGSHKTSLTMALVKPNDEAVPKFTFKDTQAGLETGFAENADAVMVIDDLMPTEDSSTKRKLEANLEFVTRCFGDANGKNRNLDFCDGKGPKTQYVTHGGAIFTGEYMNSTCASSLARTLVLHIDSSTIDIERLSYCQQHKQLLSSFLQFFIMYVSENYQQSVTLIREIVMKERQRLSGKFCNARYSEYLAQLKAASFMLALYGTSIQYLAKESIDDFVEELMKQVRPVVLANDMELRDEDPAKRIATAILEGISNKTLKVLENGQIAYDDSCVIVDKDFLHITEKGLVQCYREFTFAHGYKNLDYKDSTLKTLLHNAKVLKIQYEGKKKRYATKISGQKNKRFLHLDKVELCRIAGEEMEGLR